MTQERLISDIVDLIDESIRKQKFSTIDEWEDAVRQVFQRAKTMSQRLCTKQSAPSTLPMTAIA